MFCHVCFVFLVEPANMPAQCRRKDGGILVQTSKTTYVVAYKPIHVCAKFLFASWRSIWTCWVYSTARAGSLAQDYLEDCACSDLTCTLHINLWIHWGNANFTPIALRLISFFVFRFWSSTVVCVCACALRISSPFLYVLFHFPIPSHRPFFHHTFSSV